MYGSTKTLFAVLAALTAVDAQSSCASSISASYAAPSVAPGYTARIIATGLTRPRGIKFDNSGHLLVIQAGYGLTSLSLQDDGGACVSVASQQDVIRETGLNHGLELSQDGRTLYVSTVNDVYAYPYDGANQRNTSAPRILVTNMNGSDHSTRTLLLSKKVNGTLLVSRGSFSNIDAGAAVLSTGQSHIRAFNVNNVTGSAYDYSGQGQLVGWGLRNSVGVDENPITGGIYSVENSADRVTRLGRDISRDNPGEELNFHGYLNGTSHPNFGQNFGYPYCYAAWNTADLPENGNITVGTQFGLGNPNSTNNDGVCQRTTVGPRLTFPAHWAPLDIKFSSNGRQAWITSHGSWNRDDPSGYLVFQVAFNENGEPTEPANSTRSVIPILSNPNNADCPRGCFRPAALAWDSKGRLFMTSDSTGEIYVITRTDGGGVDSIAANITATSSLPGAPSGAATSATPSPGAAMFKYRTPSMEVLCAALGMGCLLL